MPKRKLQRFAEITEFNHVFHLSFEEKTKGFFLKGRWQEHYFKNNNPVILELGCGKGEYTVGLAERFPDKNFIGIDIKGARIWRGAKTVLEKKISNVAFLRTRIDFIEACFSESEVNEIWITFPDPQPQESRERKRLTSPLFLNRYQRILKPDGVIHLKTDSFPFYEYTLQMIQEHRYHLLCSTSDLYNEPDNYFGKESNKIADEVASINTFYETKFLQQKMKICYLKFMFLPIAANKF